MTNQEWQDKKKRDQELEVARKETPPIEQTTPPEVIPDDEPKSQDTEDESLGKKDVDSDMNDTILPKFGTVTIAKLNVRSEPSKQGEVVTILDQENVVKILWQQDGWASVLVPSGLKGYVMTEYINID